MNENFKIAKYIKEFIFVLDEILINYPRRDFELRNRLLYDSYNLLELIYQANYMSKQERKPLQIQALMKINLLDFYLESSFKKRIISERQSIKLSGKLLLISKMIYKWIENEKC